jgi:hypothetical protein
VADVVLNGAFDRAHERRYAHVPFEVPPGVRGLRVAYDYSDRISSDPLLSGGNTLDIGLFDPRGIAPSSPGFRGWSGSNKLEFVLGEAWATPPYLAGPILAGTWRVLLGPYKVGPRGCEYSVTVDFLSDVSEAPTRPLTVDARRVVLSGAAEPGWLRGDLHCHTLHSDGDSWPTDMLAHAVERGLDFLGVTDHNQVGHQADYLRVSGSGLPLVLPGIEVTTYGGHWNAWGTATWWEFREPTSEATSRAMTLAAASGAVVSVNHPKPFGPAWEYPNAVGYHAIEVWNGAWERLNHVSLAWWEEQLRAGRRIVALGGSDTHNLKEVDPDNRHGRMLGLPTTWARVTEATPDGVLSALRRGDVFISRDVDGPQLYLSRFEDSVVVRAVDALGAALMLVSANGVEAADRVTGTDWSEIFRLKHARGYLRAQLMDEHGQMLALTNPLFDLT